MKTDYLGIALDMACGIMMLAAVIVAHVSHHAITEHANAVAAALASLLN